MNNELSLSRKARVGFAGAHLRAAKDLLQKAKAHRPARQVRAALRQLRRMSEKPH
jgi:hypothetical protein